MASHPSARPGLGSPVRYLPRLGRHNAGNAYGMTIPEEPVLVDPPEPEVVTVPEPTAPVEVPEPSVVDTPEHV
jgi:hypothetical protein